MNSEKTVEELTNAELSGVLHSPNDYEADTVKAVHEELVRRKKTKRGSLAEEKSNAVTVISVQIPFVDVFVLVFKIIVSSFLASLAIGVLVLLVNLITGGLLVKIFWNGFG